jgi:predicted ATPase
MIYDLERLKRILSSFINIDKDIYINNENSIRADIISAIVIKLTNIKLFKCDLEYKDFFNLVDGNNGIAVSLLLREEINITRDYNKRTNGNMDLYPFGDLYLSDIRELADYLRVKYEDKSTKGYSYKEIHDMDIINTKTNIIFNDEQPSLYKEWYGFTLPQKELIIKLHHREKVTRHKKIPKDKILDISKLRLRS